MTTTRRCAMSPKRRSIAVAVTALAIASTIFWPLPRVAAQGTGDALKTMAGILTDVWDSANHWLRVQFTASTVSWTQSLVTLSGGTSATLIAANSSRKKLRWMVTGTNPMTVAPGLVTVTAGAGMNYNGAATTGYQGGADSFDGDASTQAFSAISANGTTVTVWEGQ